MQHRTPGDRPGSAISPTRRLGVEVIGPYQFHRPTPQSRSVQYGRCSTRVSS